MSFLKRLFGGAPPAPPEPRVAAEETYKGFHIAAAPIPENGQFRLAATISKEVGGETKAHHLIRADVLMTEEEAADFAIRKAKKMIDELGERLFGD
ncbi:HlyU family transcriptional regulator [Faunimonas sp. B44]|uniref:HlyU family transcriptional regulator n=1 Tax=Faunimonas sp. B44 TaxID=3461493 RepID=UPI0040448A50